MSASARPALRTLHPAYFAMVMATGIIAIACMLIGQHWISRLFFGIATVSYVVLWCLYITRAIRYWDDFKDDLRNHSRGVGYFTVVAATCVLGSQFLLLGNMPRIALILWMTGIVLWLIITYGIFTVLTTRELKPPLEAGLNGGWLTSVVAAQSVSVLGSQLAPHFNSVSEPVLFFSLIAWLGGGMLYIWLISLIFLRYTFYPMRPNDLAPPYWINMGAMAISTLAGTFLVDRSSMMPLLSELLPYIKGVTLLFWATATWWIPMLLTLGWWRHVMRRYPFGYDPLYWGGVFPLGMYAACTFRLEHVLQLESLKLIPYVFAYASLIAWIVTFTGMMRAIVHAKKSPVATV